MSSATTGGGDTLNDGSTSSGDPNAEQSATVSDAVTLKWIPPTADEIQLTFELNGWLVYALRSEVVSQEPCAGNGWVGFGLGSGMADADIWIMNMNNGKVVVCLCARATWLLTCCYQGAVVDAKSTGYAMPTADSKQDVTLVSATASNGKTVYVVKCVTCV